MIPFEQCRPYLPRLVAEWQRDDPDALWRLIEGSMVFVDISGFTSMSERLGRLGRAGSEEVTSVISETFDHLLTEANELGGSLLKFGGDALLLWFTGDRHPTRAASAALRMRAGLRERGQFTTPAGTVRLRMSVGATSGEFHFFLVGESHRELIVAGPATTATVAMEEAAGSGQILVGAEMAERLPPAFLGRRREPGTLLTRDDPSLEGRSTGSDDLQPRDVDLTHHIPTALRDVVLASGVLAEHRRVTVAFIRFTGVDHLLESAGVEETSHRLDEFVRRIQKAVDGHRVCFLGTDVARDGGKVILSAGAPAATGDDEERMLFALGEIDAADLGLALRVGVNRGHVFAGEIGPEYRRTYTVMGDTVNLAARLMARAGEREILATREVLDGSRAGFEAAELEQFHVKGKRLPVTAFSVGRASGARAHAGHIDLRLLGRDEELGAMRAAWEAAQRGEGMVVEVSAEAGMGKSRLVAEFLDRADAARVLHAEARIYQSTTPYFVFRTLLSQALAVDHLSPQAAAERVEDLVAERAPELVPWLALIGVVMDLELEESNDVAALQDEFRRDRLEATIDALLEAVLDEPAIMLIEDGHWMDAASRGLLNRLAGNIANRALLICLTTRPGDGLVDRDESLRRIALRPLDEADAVTLIAEAAGDSHLLPQQIRELARRSNGNPLFLLELVRALGSGEDVVTIPDSVEGLIRARIDHLSPSDRNALGHLAVLGESFGMGAAAAVLADMGASDPEPVVRRLEGFISIDANAFCEFEHALIREVAYAGLPFRARSRLHSIVAEWVLESEDDSGERAALLSVHFFEAGRWDEAWRYSRLAGDLAKDGYANVEASRFYERALDSARRLDDVATGQLAAVVEALGEVRDLAGQYPEAGAAFRSARKLVADPLAEARLRLKEAWIEEKRGRYSNALRWLTMGRRTIESLTGPEAEAMRAQLSAWRAAMRLVQGRLEAAIEWAERAVVEAERGSDQDALAHALYLHDAANVYLGRPIDESNSHRALEIYEELGNLSGQAIVANNLAGFAYFAGRWTDALELYERSREARLRAGDPVEAVRAGAGIGEILCDQGDLEGARLVLEDALKVWRAAKYPYGIAFVVSQLGRVASRAGDFSEADRRYEEARSIFLESKARHDVLETDTRIAENLVYQGRAVEALGRIEAARASAVEIGGEPVQIARLDLLAGYTATQRGDLVAAREAFEKSLTGARNRSASYEIALALEALARLDRLEGRPDWRDGLEECRTIYDRLGVISVPVVPLVDRTEH
ncbi:MAG TPA: adenylate/guanylate cyclase domain-containing protein [Acidimicrobiia bacterium]|nr:adenylate/guanylate cyclase domain-containing protein [Acidimicrobiia bacterium]